MFVESFSQLLESGSGFAILLAFLGGILASLTPCVYPMIPITVGFIGGRAQTKSQAIQLSLIYVLGMCVMYTSLGIIAASTGKVFGKMTQLAWINGLVGLIIIYFGLAELKWVPFQLPWAKMANLGENSNHHRGAFWMGLTSGLVAAPCTAPILGVILTFIATQQSLLFGIALMFSFSLGLGLLLFLLGVFSGFLTLLPKSGTWLEGIKKCTGVLLLLIGCYFLYQALRFI